MPQRMTLADYPGVPEGAYVCEEGWLCIGEEAWTWHEWRAHMYGGRPVQYHDAHHIRKRIQKREYYACIRARRAA